LYFGMVYEHECLSFLIRCYLHRTHPFLGIYTSEHALPTRILTRACRCFVVRIDFVHNLGNNSYFASLACVRALCSSHGLYFITWNTFPAFVRFYKCESFVISNDLRYEKLLCGLV
jgi:hypothetical protein